MDTLELNQKLNALLQSALLGVASGHMSAAAAVGMLELHRAEFLDRLRCLSQAQANAKKSPVILPPTRPTG